MKTIILSALLGATATAAGAQSQQAEHMRDRAELARLHSQDRAAEIRERAQQHQQQERARQAELHARSHNH